MAPNPHLLGTWSYTLLPSFMLLTKSRTIHTHIRPTIIHLVGLSIFKESLRARKNSSCLYFPWIVRGLTRLQDSVKRLSKTSFKYTFLRPLLLTPSDFFLFNVKITLNFSRQKPFLVKPVIRHERTLTSFARTGVSALKNKTLACNEILTGGPRTPWLTQRDMQAKWKQMMTKRKKSHGNYFFLIESHCLGKKMQLK